MLVRMLRICSILIAVVFASAGCTAVKPWERDVLARRDMAFDPDPLATDRLDHVYNSKEASLPGASAGGGGCGCN